jgi:RimJ/RimL family protein N-acetyltransferase
VQEGVLRRSFLRDGQYMDQALWAILADDWRVRSNVIFPTIH